MTPAQEGELRRLLQLGSLHDVNAAIGLLRDLEAVEPVHLPFAVIRYVLQEIDHRFEGQPLTLSTWRRIQDLVPPFAGVLGALNSDRDSLFTALDDLVSAWMKAHAAIG